MLRMHKDEFLLMYSASTQHFSVCNMPDWKLLVGYSRGRKYSSGLNMATTCAHLATEGVHSSLLNASEHKQEPWHAYQTSGWEAGGGKGVCCFSQKDQEHEMDVVEFMGAANFHIDPCFTA